MKKYIIWFSVAVFVVLIFAIRNSFYLTRALYYNYPSIEDYKIFPERKISSSGNPFIFPKDNTKFNFESINDQFSEKYNISSNSNFEDFLISTQTTAFTILKNDTIVYEKYFNGYNRGSINTSFSTSKSITSALVGIAIDEGHIISINDPVLKYIPEVSRKAHRDLTIKSLVTMTSGIKYDDESELFGDDAKSYYSPDLREYALDFSAHESPGKRFEYNNINPLLIGIILERATGMAVAKYLEEKIWKPLGAEFPASWSLDENGFEKMESGINARAIDFLKFGRLFLNNGIWENEQIISEEYVKESTQINLNKPELRNIYRELSYAYYWWIFNRYQGPDDFYAEGNLGQFIYVSPFTKTVIVRHGKDYGYNRWPEFFNKLANEISGLPLTDNPFEIEYSKTGLKSAIAIADSLRVSEPDEMVSEYYLNRKGYELLGKGKVEEAIAVFQLNVRSYPKSFNVYDSLGEAYLENNQTELAKINYQKSLELNPDNTNAVEQIKSINNRNL